MNQTIGHPIAVGESKNWLVLEKTQPSVSEKTQWGKFSNLEIHVSLSTDSLSMKSMNPSQVFGKGRNAEKPSF